MGSPATSSVIHNYTAAELKKQPDVMSALSRVSLCHEGLTVAQDIQLRSTEVRGVAAPNCLYWFVVSGDSVQAMAAGYADMDDEVFELELFCWEEGAVHPADLRKLYEVVFAYAQEQKLTTLRMDVSDDRVEVLGEFLQERGMTRKRTRDQLTFTVRVPPARQRPVLKAHPVPVHPLNLTADTGKVFIYPPGLKASGLYEVVARAGYAVNLLSTYAATHALSRDATLFILIPHKKVASTRAVNRASGFAVVRKAADQTCTVTDLFADNVEDVNTLLRAVARKACTQIQMRHTTVGRELLLDGQWGQNSAVLHWTPPPEPAHGAPPTLTHARRVTIGHEADVFEVMPRTLGKQLAKRDADDMGVETSWSPGAAYKYALVPKATGARATGSCATVMHVDKADMAAHPELVAALRESQLCQGSTYLALAVDGLLGWSQAGVRSRSTSNSVFWFVVSDSVLAANICAAAITRVSDPRNLHERVPYREGLMEHFQTYGRQEADKTLQIKFLCWREGTPVESLHQLLTDIETYAKSIFCARVWTYMRPEETMQIKLLKREGYVLAASGLYEKVLFVTHKYRNHLLPPSSP